MTDFNPLQLKCTSCGAPVEDFDIIKQEYRCASCGCGISAHSVKENYDFWQQEHAEETAKTVGHHTEKGLACPSCGAENIIISLPVQKLDCEVPVIELFLE